jgi:CHAD domain-containing protein
MADESAVPAARAAALELTKRMTAEQAFAAIVANCMAQIEANAPCVARGRTPECLHQMRVGLRRLRAALGMFRQILQSPPHLLRELDWLAGQLGPARDWDVLSTSTLDVLATCVCADWHLADIDIAAQDKAREHHDLASAAVVSPRYARLMRYFGRWLRARAWRAGMDAGAIMLLDKPARKRGRIFLRQCQRRLHKRGAKLKAFDARGRHRLRIAAKKARYAAEFFAPLLPAQPYIDALSAMQDELGRINDLAVADRLLAELQDGRGDLASGVAHVRAYLCAQVDADSKQVRKLRRKVAALKVPV